MKMNALRKEFFMEIKKSQGRFLSILFIVAIGVAFFTGIRATEPDMRLSGDEYFDERNMTDLQIISTLGLTDEDVKALEYVEGVDKAEAGYSTDVLCADGESQSVLHLMSILPTMNELTVETGRLPKVFDECVLDADYMMESGYEIGDRITFSLGSDADVLDTLATDTFIIVGSVSSPCYISFQRGNTTIGTGSISGFACVPEEAFVLEVYTEVYAKVEGAKELTAFTDEYNERVDEVKVNIEAIREEREEARYQEIVGEASGEISEAKQELEDAKKEASEELSDAQAEIDDGKAQLEDGKAEVEAGLEELEDSRTQLNASQSELNQNIASMNSQKSTLNQNLSDIQAKRAELNQNLSDIQAKRAELEQNLITLESKKEELNQGREELSSAKTQYQILAAARDALQSLYDELLSMGATEEEISLMYQGLVKAEAAVSEMAAQIADAEAQLAAGEAQLADAQAQIDAGFAQLDTAEAQIIEGLSQLDTAETQINSGLTQINSAQGQISSAQAQIDSGWDQLAVGEKELSKAQEEISSNEKKLADAQSELDEAKAEADEKIADGEAEIADAEAEIAKIEKAKWYINDRADMNSDYTGMGENADRMKALGQVFPVIFFLVAALISLTTMTRMVEEQRTQIGTLKALGYEKKAIAGKYLGYAFIATVIGSIIGFLFGEKVFPAVIIIAYQAMYPYVPNVVVPYELKYTLMAVLAAMACTMLASLLSSYKELMAQPAELMRPPVPKKGKRVFLERIPFIWKRMNFTWKATIRNLTRYKKRFFMTLFGIGGCMGLLLVGFGLRDSIYEIGHIQYHELQLYEGNIILNEDAASAEKEDACELLAAKSEVENTSKSLLKQVTIGNGDANREVYLNVPEKVEDFSEFVVHRDRITHENYSLSDEGVILTEKAAKKLNVKVGDTIFIKDDAKGQLEVKVSAVCENYMYHYIYMTPALYEQIYGAKPEYNAVYYLVQDENEELAKKIGEEVLKEEGALSVTYTADIEEQLNHMLGALNMVMIVLIIAAGLLAFVVLYNLNNINITERKRELATLKVLGFYPGEVAAYVYRENMILTVLGAFIGCFVGVFLHQFTIETVEIDTAMFGRTISPSSFVFSFLITLAFSILVNGVMYFKLEKIDMVESLKSVE
ncbi:MAG: FtsX-like permease family protein [Ruminococcus sp.]|nr:FtsX-like permease family protein [Ruminococcus sp.]